MKKTKLKFALTFLATATIGLTGCKSGGDSGGEGGGGGSGSSAVVFWSSFGSSYSAALNKVVNGVATSTGVEIDHKPQGSYEEIQRNMDSAIAMGDYPNLAIGYPDHFASYLGSDVLKPLDEYFTEAELNDYYSEYMVENKFYDNGKAQAKERIYGVPFNKSTELLGYNGVFVDYCATINQELAKIPATWGDWNAKGPEYNAIFKDLFGKAVYGLQKEDGTAYDFKVVAVPQGQDAPGIENEDGDKVHEGRLLLLDMSKVDATNSLLMSWDATDNAFITLTRQWGAKYTEVPESEKTKIAKKRVGNVLFNSSENQPKVIEMLKFFRRLHQQRIFGIPNTLGGTYSSGAFEICQVMFMICSSGGLSYNTANWRHRFRVAPIPYFDQNNKTVISQGANLTMTDKGKFEDSVKVMKALTTGKFQTEWCLQTGYYPCSKSATNSADYQAFLNETKYYPEVQVTRVAYREGSKLNSDHYMNEAEGWKKFVDPAFQGSSILRSAVKGVLDSIFKIEDADIEDNNKYKAKLNEIENAPTIKGESTISFIH